MTGEQFRYFVIWLLRTAVEYKRDQCWSVYAYIVLHRESRKNKTPNSSPHLRQILIDFRHFLRCYTRQEICNKAIIQIQPNLKGVATLPCEILVSKNCSDWQHTVAADQVRTHCEGMWPWLASCCQATITRQNSQKCSVQHFSTSYSTICGRMDHFLHGDLGLKCSKKRLLKNWLKQTAMRNLSAENSCWMMLSLFGSVIKSYSH